ncbi:MAG: 1-deoxy-D-xylulose-5-phosphate reductoisomerase [Deltaproteobacteria bacterium]|nr:1-deoxy-D-xylulose-5-phosphate reductoisomerase [Deltaproteobacteria bacterium]
MAKKRIAALGSTGSIGVNALKVIQANPEKYEAVALAAGRNTGLLLKQIKEFRPQAVSVLNKALESELKMGFANNSGPEVFSGSKGVIHLATMDGVDTVISAMTGAAGFLPTYEAIHAGKHVALANKETMVMAGPLVMEMAKKQGVSVIPIDSEHSAILQSLHGHPREDLKRIILTASGGPFRDVSLEDMHKVTPEQALNHPNWNMGAKISVDSATLMNKGLEAIEAKWLFDLDMDQISILVHPESIVHSMVEYKDGSVIAQLGVPDMTIPISYALSFPRHVENELPPLALERIGMLNFEKPDLRRFRCLDLALQAAAIGDSMPAVLNGSNEIAVQLFLEGKIGFRNIPRLIDMTMERHQPFPVDSVEAVMEADRWAREKTGEALGKL